MTRIDVIYNNSERETFYPDGTHFLRHSFLQFEDSRIGTGKLDIIIPYSNILSIEIENGKEEKCEGKNKRHKDR